MKKRYVITVAAMIGTFAALTQAAPIIDEFTRDDTALNQDASVSIGSNYALSALTGDKQGVQIDNNQVAFGVFVAGTTAPAHVTLARTDVTLLSGTSGTYTNIVSGDITTYPGDAGSISYGVAMNIQSDGSFYAARIDTGTNNDTVLQFIRSDGSGVNAFGSISGSYLAHGSVYNLKFETSAPGVIDYTLTGANLAGGALTGTVTDTVLQLSGGLAGFYSSNGNASPRFDNLSIELIPEPATLGLFVVSSVGLFFGRRVLKH